ncbi:MAG: acyl-ACP--UDP-N-acetylglucosamine O-acyltransferase [Planctomycetes bacterium]|nr:acyl-ACP--UDP-N-acetylglucosamine O-acyltransferase [Planctomycetota bacterium]
MIKVHSSAVVSKEAQLGDGVTIGPNCVIDSMVSIGAGTVIDANVVIGKNVNIGQNNHFFANCVIGGRPQILGLSPDAEIGGLMIGDRNNFREQVTVHLSAHRGEIAKVGNDNLLMVGVHIGHDSTLEDMIVMSNSVQIGGHCKIETGAWFSGLAGMHQFVTVGKWCYAAGLAGITRDIPPFLIVSGHYPSIIRGVNKRGLERAGMNEEQQEKIFEAYKRLYRNDDALLENAKALSQEDGIDENVRAMVDMIIKSSEHRYGRYLEKFK